MAGHGGPTALASSIEKLLKASYQKPGLPGGVIFMFFQHEMEKNQLLLKRFWIFWKLPCSLQHVPSAKAAPASPAGTAEPGGDVTSRGDWS